MDNIPPTPPMPAWLAGRVRAAGGNLAPRYEASLYGPINCLLTWHFPLARQFMIKPQPKIRPEYISDIPPGEDQVRTSIDSYGGEVLPRDEKGGEKRVKIPDFIVVKATASLHDDRPLMIAEIKRGVVTVDSAGEQLASYFEAVEDKNKFL